MLEVWRAGISGPRMARASRDCCPYVFQLDGPRQMLLHLASVNSLAKLFEYPGVQKQPPRQDPTQSRFKAGL